MNINAKYVIEVDADALDIEGSEAIADGLCKWSDIGRPDDRKYRDEGDIDDDLDALLVGILTLRQSDGVVEPSAVRSLAEWERQLLSDEYTAEELWPDADADRELILRDLYNGVDFDGEKLLHLNATEWRALLRPDSTHLPAMLHAIAQHWLVDAYRKAHPYIRWAMLRHPACVVHAVTQITRFAECDGG